MPRSLDPDKYPPDYLILLDRAQREPVVIPSAAPAGLRGHIQAFLRACENSLLHSAAAKATQATSHVGDPLSADVRRRQPHVLVQRRTESNYAKAVASAIGLSHDEETAAAAADFLSRVKERQP